MRGISRAAWLLCFIALLAACDSTPEERLAAACTTFCGCEVAPLPSQQEECVGECVQDGDFLVLSEACTDCITAHANSCATLEFDCEPICDPGPDPIPEDPPFIDAGGFPSPADAFVEQKGP